MSRAESLGANYLFHITDLLQRIQAEERRPVSEAALWLAYQITDDRLVHILGPVAILTSLARKCSSELAD